PRHELAADVCAAVARDGIVVKNEVRPDLPVPTLESEFRLALLGIVQNAVEAYPEGASGTVVIGAESRDGGWEVVVRDDGAGISADRLSRIFDPFYSTKNGAGLGLAFASTVLARHQGTIRVESDVRRGSRFTLVL